MKPKVGSLKIKIRGAMEVSEQQHFWKKIYDAIFNIISYNGNVNLN
jgi:hypothetical protein